MLHYYYYYFFKLKVFGQSLEPVVHGRGRKADSLEDTYFGVHQEQLYARKLKPVEGRPSCLFSCYFFIQCLGNKLKNIFLL